MADKDFSAATNRQIELFQQEYKATNNAHLAYEVGAVDCIVGQGTLLGIDEALTYLTCPKQNKRNTLNKRVNMKGTLIGIAVTLLSASSWAVDLNAIYNNLDITSFNSSLRAMQINQEDTFSDFKELSQPIISGKEIIIEDDFWLLSLEVVKEDGNDIIPASKTERKEEAITYSSL